MRKIAWLLILMICFVSVSQSYAKNLYAKFRGVDPIAIYVDKIDNSSGDKAVTTEKVKSVFKDIVEERKEVKFKVVSDIKDADVVIDIDVKEYEFTDKAGVRLTGGMWGVVGDTAEPKNMCIVKATYVVRDPKTGNIITRENNVFAEARKPRETFKQDQTTHEAIEKNVETFLVKVFYQPKKRPQL
ncbi:MAG: hypothetical protein PHQ52_06045 [Candidatus Omnitrophica bacterium]|nr:hypothetical protein [Candidatus Omnitrophota bacterium]